MRKEIGKELFSVLREVNKANTIWIELVRKSHNDCERKDNEIIELKELVQKFDNECVRKDKEIIELKRRVRVSEANEPSECE